MSAVATSFARSARPALEARRQRNLTAGSCVCTQINRRTSRLPASVRCGGPVAARLSEVLVERGKLFVIHSSDETPRHLLSQMMTIRVRASAHRVDELLSFPLLYQIQPRPDGGNLTWLAAVQVGAVALAAVLIA